MAECGNCRGQNPASAKFCENCGAPLATSCPACGTTPSHPAARFCLNCGQALTGAPAPPAAVEMGPVAERRICSVLFCDLVGFTPLSESRDPEEVRELLSRYFDSARTVVARYGGTIEKFIGDAVMAVWGTPVALEGDTERAVRAALELVDAIAALGAEVGAVGLSARAGVVTGEVAVTLGATNEGMVAGDAVNTAARVQAAATAGTVLVDDTPRRLAQASVGFADAGVHELKGKSEPQPLWRAARILSNVGGAQRVDGLEAPLTGRDVELRLIKDQFHASLDRRQPRLVVVSGPAGVGKSRLGWEFEKYVDGLAVVTAWHRGRCLSYGDGVSFWALGEIVRQRLTIAEDDPVEEAADKLRFGLETYLPDDGDRQYVGPRLARLLGLPFPGDVGAELERGELFAGWRLWFERIATQRPVVLLIEDLQYADTGLLDFLDHLVDWARDVPVFVLAFSRPELETARPGWGSGRNRTLLALDPLDAASLDQLIDALVPDMPADASRAIAGQAQGIPLFAVETIRTLVDRDVVVPRDGVYRLVGEVGTLTVPDSLHGLLAARLDALEPDVRSLVADAAVLGSAFPAEALVAVSGREPGAVRSALDDLVRREVFAITADPLSPQRGAYRFAHEMLRQVAYDTLSRRDRKTRHLAVAAHLRETFPGDGEEVVDVLAQHYLDALRAVSDDPDAETVRALAVAALIRAGERAKRTGAPDRAAENFASAADLLDESTDPEAGVEAARLAERAAHAAVDSTANLDRGIELADRAKEGFLKSGNQRDAARTQVTAGRALRYAGRHVEARARLEAALAVLEQTPDQDTVAALDQLGALATFAGADDAGVLTEEALVLAQALGANPDLMSAAFGHRAVWLAQNGRRAESIAHHRAAARFDEQAANRTNLGITLMNLADVLTPIEPAEAVEMARAAAAELRRSGFSGYLTYALMNQATANLELGEWAEADTVLNVTAEEDGIGERPEIACYRAWIAALSGEADRARELLAGLGAFLDNEAPQERSFVLLAKAFAALAARNPVEALEHVRGVLAYERTVGISAEQQRWAWPLATRCAHLLGDADAVRDLLAMLNAYRPGELVPMLHAERALVHARLAEMEGADDADARFTDAIARLRDGGTPYHLAQGLLDYAEYLLRTSSSSRADALIAEGAAIADKLGARPVRERADSLRTASVR